VEHGLNSANLEYDPIVYFSEKLLDNRAPQKKIYIKFRDQITEW
jgi:hypothetical protein